VTDPTLIKAASVALALGFSGAVALLIRSRFGGWASDSAMGRGACLSLLTIGVAIMLSPFASALVVFRLPDSLKVWGEAFVAAGLCEETARYVALLLLLRGLLTADPREFVAGAAAIGLGFGVIENLFYLMGSSAYLELGALRGVLSAPAHLSFAFVSGYGLWSVARRGKPIVYALLFFLLATFLHGAFDVAMMSWPNPDKPIPKDYGAWKLAGVGVTIFAAILSTTVATLLTMTEFLDWADKAPKHDPNVSHDLGHHWSGFAATLSRVAGALVLAPGLIAFTSQFSIGVLYAPLVLGAAGSLALWSMAIFELTS
jgi:hypothetical protein